MMKIATGALVAAAIAIPAAIAGFVPGQAAAQERTLTLGFSGLMDRRNREEIPEIILGVGVNLGEAPIELLSGGYYRMNLTSDGSGEIAVEGPGFFRNIWINEVVINDIEIRPMGGIDSIEFDAAGTARISFIAIRPGQYFLQHRGARGDSQRVEINIR